MITIVVTTQDEYDEMMKFARKYVCMHMSFAKCETYPPNSCDKCFKDNHIKMGIRIFSPVDSTPPDNL